MLNHALLPVKEEKQPRYYYGYTILITSFLILVIAGGALYSFGVFFKPLLNEFGWTRAVTSGAYSLNLVLGGGFGILAGRLSDRFGPRLILTLGGLLVGLGYLLMSQVNSIWQVYLFYGIFVSMGMGALTVPVPSAVVRWFSKKRGLATGIVMAGIGVGIVIMPPLANLFISSYSWRTSYTILGLITLAAIVILAQFIRRPPDQKNHVKAVANTVNTDVPNLQAQGLSLREAVRTGKFWIVILIGFFCYFGTQTVMVHLVAHATDIQVSAAVAATILSVVGMISIGSKIGMGSLGDRFGNRNIMIMVFILVSLAFLWLRFAGELWMLYFFAVIFGLGYGGFVAVQSPMVADYFGLKSHGVIFGLALFSANSGGALGSLVAGRIFDIKGNYELAFLICAVVGIAGLILSLLLKSTRKRVEK